jgi:voltage-gated potassium channel
MCADAEAYGDDLAFSQFPVRAFAASNESMPLQITLENALSRQRWHIIKRLEAWFETPMALLGFLWLVLLVVEFVWGLSPLLECIGTGIWILFIFDFAIRFTLAPGKRRFLKKNWLTALALALPALRVLRIFRAVRILRAGRAVRGLRLVRLLTSVNRGMRALGASMRRRGFGYVVVLTFIVMLAGAAGMYTFEDRQRMPTYADALWWTAMMMTTMGSEVWPQTGEGRLLCLVLAVYAFAVFGYTTAAIATFFVGRDAESSRGELAGTVDLRMIRDELQVLRRELKLISRHTDGPDSAKK